MNGAGSELAKAQEANAVGTASRSDEWLWREWRLFQNFHELNFLEIVYGKAPQAPLSEPRSLDNADSSCPPLLPSTTEANEAHATEANYGFLPKRETSRAMASAASISEFDEGAV